MIILERKFNQMKQIYLKDILPAFADEIKDALMRMNMPDIASQIDNLTIYKRCDCPDAFCSSFYTAENETANDTIVLDIDWEFETIKNASNDVTVSVFKKEPQEMVFLDVDKENKIIFVEALNKPEINTILDEKTYKVEKIDI